MTSHAISSARSSAILHIQKIRSRRVPGSFDFDVADHAIDLVLSENRPESDYLVTNALKDARSVLIRQRRRSRMRGMLPFSETDNTATGQELADAIVSTQRTFSQDVASNDSYYHLRGALGENGYLPDCLDGWRDGEKLSETAARLSISREYVKKLRGRIRSIAVTCVGLEGVG